MPPTPKRRHSKARKGKRMAARSVAIPEGVTCKHCGKLTLSHRVCIHCGK